jgi:murein DD-endopeptidase MepM/ murein hydrolase activator NlpD
MRRIAPVLLACAGLAMTAVAAAHAASTRVAALQVGLRAHGYYGGNVDGVDGPATSAGLRAFQRRRGLLVDGVLGPQTRRALGRLGRHSLGSRPLRLGAVGWDVAELQFELESHGFPLGHVDGGFGFHTDAALRRAQAWAGLIADGIAGPATLRALQRPPARAPYLMRRPIAAAIGDGYGPRGDGWHPGLDFPAPRGTPVYAAASGTVIEADRNDGYGKTVLLRNAGGVETRYAHFSRILVRYGQFVGAGALIGRVGSTGFATGPHLHFEVIVRGANVNPLTAL